MAASSRLVKTDWVKDTTGTKISMQQAILLKKAEFID